VLVIIGQTPMMSEAVGTQLCVWRECWLCRPVTLRDRGRIHHASDDAADVPHHASCLPRPVAYRSRKCRPQSSQTARPCSRAAPSLGGDARASLTIGRPVTGRGQRLNVRLTTHVKVRGRIRTVCMRFSVRLAVLKRFSYAMVRIESYTIVTCNLREAAWQ
jgi:hypothetical protein